MPLREKTDSENMRSSLNPLENVGHTKRNRFINEIKPYAFADLEDYTEYSFLITTDLSERLDNIFGFDKYFDTIYQNIDRTCEKDIERVRSIQKVFFIPVLGVSGQIKIPVTKEIDYNIRSAISSLNDSYESIKVAGFFSELATRVGFLFALPYKEVIKSTENNITFEDVERAIEEGYIRHGYTRIWDGKPIEMIELTEKFSPI